MNLINDAWIPIRRKSGLKEKIAPWQLTDKYEEDPIIELAAVRPDFNGALIQFLIGLLQTTCAPKGKQDWREWLNNPPSPNELKAKFETVVNAFNLNGTGPRFMQDLTIENEEKKTTEEIEKLLIDAPGEQTLKQNKDLFIKRNRVKQMCLSCCTQALLTLQINAPEGGKGHWAGLRGGGPVVTVVLGANLWQTIWNNVIPESEYSLLANTTNSADVDKFPWLSKTRISAAKTTKNEKGKKQKTYTNTADSQNIHPAQIYWPMPRRIRIAFDNATGECDLCYEKGLLVKEYFTRPYGIKYLGLRHPLTPVYKRENEILSKHFQENESLGYRHWLGFVQNDAEGDNYSANVISIAFNRLREDFRIWAFGYDMDSMKARGWYEGVMPVVFMEDEKKWKAYCADVVMLIRAAETISGYVSKAVVKALNASVFNVVRQRFWQETESEFYLQIEVLRQAVLGGSDTVSVRQVWHRHLVKKALEIFNDMSQADMIELVNAKRVAKEQNELCRNLYGNKLKIEILGLPKQGGVCGN